MAETRTGKRTAHIKAQIVEQENGSIKMYLRDTTSIGITFDKESGRSGPNAYRKLAQFLDEDGEASGKE